MTDKETGNRITDIDEANRIIEKLRIRNRNQRKHLRHFNRIWDALNRGNKMDMEVVKLNVSRR